MPRLASSASTATACEPHPHLPQHPPEISSHADHAMRSFQETQKRWSLLFSDDSIGVDLRQAVKDADGPSLCEDGLRSICWKAFLLYGPPSQASWPKKLSESRNAYTSLREHFLKYIDHPDDLQSTVDPLADDDNSPWSSLRQDEANRQEIFQDVERCMQDNYFFREPATKKKMLDILFIYSKLNPDTGYRQGMHELLAPILWAVECDAQNGDSKPHAESQVEGVDLMLNALDFDYIEHDSFNLFCAVMQTTKSFYEIGESRDSTPIVSRSHRIHEEILAAIDPELADHMQVIGILPQVYLIRWVRLLFGREFDFDDVLRTWDLLFAESLSLGLVDMTCIAMLLRIRWTLMEADYSSALTLLLHYSLPRSSPHKPASLVKDAFYLDQNRTPQAGAKLVQHYSGRSLATSSKHKRVSSDFTYRRPSIPTSQSPSRFITRQTGTASAGRSPARFLPQQRNLESLFQEVSGNIQKRTEGWNLSKTLQGAVGEVKRNMNSLANSPQAPRVGAGNVTEPLFGSPVALDESGALLKRIHELEERNKALSKMLDGALDSLRLTKLTQSVAAKEAEDTFNISLAKIQFVSVYLSDPEIPIPPDNLAKSDAVVSVVAADSLAPNEVQPAEIAADEVQAAEPGENKENPPANEKGQVTMLAETEASKPELGPSAQLKRNDKPSQEQKSRRTLRPSLAESSFSFMLGEDRHRSSFVSSVADLPEQTRIEQIKEIESKSRPKQISAESRKEHEERRGSESEDDGFTMTSLRGATK